MLGGRIWHVGWATLGPPQAFAAAARSTARLIALRASSRLNGGTRVLRKSAWRFGLGAEWIWLAYRTSSLDTCFGVNGADNHPTSPLPSTTSRIASSAVPATWMSMRSGYPSGCAARDHSWKNGLRTNLSSFLGLEVAI